MCALSRSHKSGLPVKYISTGHAEHCAGGSWATSLSCLSVHFNATVYVFVRFSLPLLPSLFSLSACSTVQPKLQGKVVSISHPGSVRHRCTGVRTSLKPTPPSRVAAGTSPLPWGAHARHSQMSWLVPPPPRLLFLCFLVCLVAFNCLPDLVNLAC